MDKEKLIGLLDLSGKDARAGPDPLAVGPAGTAPPSSPTALVLDAWCLRRGRDALDAGPRMQALKIDADAAADFVAAAFEPAPDLAEDCADPLRRGFVAELLDTVDYHALHATTMLDAPASEVAAVAFAERFAKFRDDARGKGTAGAAAGAAGLAALRAAGAAAVEATKEVAELREAAAGFGLGAGAPGSNDPAAIAALYRRVRSSPTLRRVSDLAGRFRRVAQSKRRQRTGHGSDEVVGVEMGSDVSRLLPSELARLAVPGLDDDLLRRLVEGQALCREASAVEPVGKGPVVVSVDESGSMAGDKVVAAKALALALAWIARRQRRWCGLASYSGDSGHRLLALPPGRWDESALADWVEAFLGGGSDVDVPVRELPDFCAALGAPPGRTDVVMVTDALVRLPARVAEPFLAWKRAAGVRVYALVVGGAAAGDLTAVCDEVLRVATLDPTEGTISPLFSI